MKYPGFILAFIVFPLVLFGQDWEVPQDKDDKLAPFEFNEESATAGKDLYTINCLSCHGTPGQNNYQALVPSPGDPATAKIQNNSDGGIFHKVSEGRGLMPSFKNILTTTEIWYVISYLRSFNDNYTQSVAIVQQLKDLKWSYIKILLSFSADDSKIITTLLGLEGDSWTPVPNAEVILSAKRTFGNLTLDEPKTTNINGVAEYTLPEDLPADREGKIELTARLTDEEVFGTISTDTIIIAGAINEAPSLVKERAMWNVGRKAPLWLTITYPAVVLSIWGFIMLVLFKLRSIYKEGEETTDLT